MSQRGFGDADSMFDRADLLLGDFLQDVAMQLMPLLVADFFAAEGHRIQAAVQIEIYILQGGRGADSGVQGSHVQLVSSSLRLAERALLWPRVFSYVNESKYRVK